MAHEFEACAECTHRCQLAHGKKKSSSHIANSFFKIMIGKQFSKFMELPPKVARVVLLSDRKTFLEDLTGQRWNVAISTVNGSLSFQQGWNAFALNHDLQVGDFLVFNYIVGSHFTVKIYDNSGCELNLFETLHQHNINRDQCHTFVKGTASTSSLVTFAGPDAEISKCLNELNGMNKPLLITEYPSTHDDDNERSKGKRKAEFAEDMSCMMKRDYGNQPEENRVHILDLSSVESFKKIRTYGSDGTKVSVVNETHSYRADLSLKLRSEADSEKIPVAKEVPNRVIPLDAAELERTEKNNYSESKVKGASLSDKDSSTNVTPGHLFPTRPDNTQQNDIFSGTLIIAAQKCHPANASGNDHQVAVSGQENDLMDDTCQSANKKITISGISKSCDTAMEVIEIEPLELTSHPCSKEVIPESNDDAMIITEKEFKEFSSDPCSQEVIPERKDEEATRAIENVIVDLTSDECSKQVIEKEESPDVSAKVDNQSSNSQRRDIPSDQAEFERTEEHNKSEAKVNKVPSDKDSCTETSDTSKPTSDISKKPTKECQNADGSELLLSNDQVALVQMEPNLMDDSVPRDNKELTGISESIHDPITFESQNLYGWIDFSTYMIINEKESLEATCQEAIPQRKAQPSKISNKLQSQSNFARENETTLPVVKSEPVEDAVATFPSFTISCLATVRQSYLELPKSLPVSLKATNGRSKMDRRVVYLQGPDNRLCPVLYIQKFFFRTLANGWEAFSMANNIEKGDRCTIAVIDQTKGICAVNVVKMRDDMEFYEEWEQQPLINLS
ncbi:hypothetical protein ACLB2K_049101 [Fragaria x ananassa]